MERKEKIKLTYEMRNRTGLSMIICYRELEANDWDIEKASKCYRDRTLREKSKRGDFITW